MTPAQSKLLGGVTLYKLVVPPATPGDPGTVFEGLDTYFDDADNDALTFTSVADRTNHVVVAGYMKNGDAIFLDMLQNDPTIDTFNLVVEATDAGKPGDPKSSTKERLEVETNAPIGQPYTVVQHAENENFIRLDKTVGLRKDIPHSMIFEGGFAFVETLTGAAVAFNAFNGLPLTKPAGTEADPSASYLTITATEAASLPATGVLAEGTPVANVVLSFLVTKTGQATVTVTFHEWVPVDNTDSVPVPAFYRDPVMRTLRFSVVAVTQKPVAL